MSVGCPRCGKPTYQAIEYDQRSACRVEVCRNCGNRRYLGQVKRDNTVWSPGGGPVGGAG